MFSVDGIGVSLETFGYILIFIIPRGSLPEISTPNSG